MVRSVLAEVTSFRQSMAPSGSGFWWVRCCCFFSKASQKTFENFKPTGTGRRLEISRLRGPSTVAPTTSTNFLFLCDRLYLLELEAYFVLKLL
jgi:hypothetical protein